MFTLLRRVCRRDTCSFRDDGDALRHGMVKVNSEGKGNRVLARLGIPLATSYFNGLSSGAHRRRGRRRGKHYLRKMVHTLVGLAL